MKLEDMEESLVNELMVNRLNFCSCGAPEEILELILKFIKLNASHRNMKVNSYLGKEWEDYCQKQKMEKTQLIIENADAVIWLLYYFLDEKGIFTHGSNVSGGWLEDENFYKALCEIFENHASLEDFK